MAIARVLPVASNATSSSGTSCSANARIPSGVAANVPAWRITPSCQIATCANSRCTSSPMHRLTVFIPPFSFLGKGVMIGSGWAKRHLRIRARSATGQVAGAANY